MKISFQKVKTEHHILSEFKKLLLIIEKHPAINRMIPGRINRQQKWSSEVFFKITTDTPSGFKCIMCKWSTAQELFIICDSKETNNIKTYIKTVCDQHLENNK